MAFVETHLNAFKGVLASDEPIHGFPGRIPAGFAAGLKDIQSEYFTNDRFTRAEVYELARSKHVSTGTVCAAILAWGGMKKPHRDLLFGKSGTKWIDHCESIRAGQLDRAEAFAGFAALRPKGKLRGMGVAYYTKLIHFLLPARKHSTGCILDQWLGCSVNLLSGKPMIHMTRTGKSHTVSDRNNAEIYEAYCQYVETLAGKLGLNVIELDQRLLSKGGREKHKGAWRRYVIKHRQP